MPFVQLPARVFIRQYNCDICSKPMKATGLALAIPSPNYPHRCTDETCDGYILLERMFPCAETIPESDLPQAR